MVLYLVLAVLFWFIPEAAQQKPGALGSLRFKLTVPDAMRGDFLRGAPAIFAGWATGGLFLSLGANIVHTELGGDAHVWQGLSLRGCSCSRGSRAYSGCVAGKRSIYAGEGHRRSEMRNCGW